MAQALRQDPARTLAPGVKRLNARRATLQRRLVLVVTVLPFAGFIYAVGLNWGHGLTVATAAIAFAFYVFTGLGITVGFHRHFTHQSFETNRFLRGLLAIAGSMAVQGPVITWVADHRRHHAFADKEGDPHSPHLDEGPGVRGLLKGLWHAHMGWLFSDEQSSATRWAPDLLRDPMIKRIDRLFPLWMLLTFALPPMVGFAVTGTSSGALSAFLWGSLVRVFFLHHVTWSINSVCHFYGKRPFEGDDFSTNNWVLAIISFGESWHNNHHAFPSSAVHGIGRGQLDMTGGAITLLEKLGLARNVKRVQEKQILAKQAE
ncbi:MAG TPA: acyl-CoA desaturase [Actinomycetota bacterium]|nr:acyl-CoA desaturase [Actinomycetota bacterium]